MVHCTGCQTVNRGISYVWSPTKMWSRNGKVWSLGIKFKKM